MRCFFPGRGLRSVMIVAISDNQFEVCSKSVGSRHSHQNPILGSKIIMERRMPLTAAQRTVFFENAAQMGIRNVTVVQLEAEGIGGVGR